MFEERTGIARTLQVRMNAAVEGGDLSVEDGDQSQSTRKERESKMAQLLYRETQGQAIPGRTCWS